MSRRTLTLLLASIFVVTFFVISFWASASSRRWFYVGEAINRTESGPLGTVEVFKSAEGNLLFWITEDSFRDQYIYYPSSGKIGIPNGDQFIKISSFVFSKDVPVPVVFSDNRVKIESDLHIVVESGELRFRTILGRQVEADLRNY